MPRDGFSGQLGAGARRSPNNPTAAGLSRRWFLADQPAQTDQPETTVSLMSNGVWPSRNRCSGWWHLAAGERRGGDHLEPGLADPLRTQVARAAAGAGLETGQAPPLPDHCDRTRPALESGYAPTGAAARTMAEVRREPRCQTSAPPAA